MSDTNTTETMVPEDTETAPSAPIAAPTTTSGSETAPTAQSPATDDEAPVASPVSVPTAGDFSEEESSPVSAPVSFPATEEEMSPTIYSPVSSPASFPSRMSAPPVPTMYGGDKTQPASMTQEVESFVLNPFHLILIAAISGVVALLIFWKCCKSWKLRREKQMLRLQSTRVDAVLGDMQMVGMDDYDGDDPELI